MPPSRSIIQPSNPLLRIRVWYALLLIVFSVFLIRLFFLQVIRHDYYQKAALQGQLKEYEIPAARGTIVAHDGDKLVPIVLNEMRYTLFADPLFVENPDEAAAKLQAIVGGNIGELTAAMKSDSRYAVLAKKLDKGQMEKIEALNLKGIGTREVPYRTYPQGSLAAQALGFVNEDGEGKYGLEQALDETLRGKPGRLKAITDAQGVPLATNRDNVAIEAEPGERVILTLDISMQQQVEDLLKEGLDKVSSKSGSALVLDAETGAVKAMANYPTYNPGEFFKVEDGNVFNNTSVSAPLEIGSIMKPLTLAATLDMGLVNKNTTYYDPGRYRIDEATVTNVEEVGGSGTRSVGDILELSLNTGATWLLMQMGGGEINSQARETWHSYMVDHYQFGKNTGIEQGYEVAGTVPDPNEGFGLDIQYANTSFGQGMSATPLQVAGAFASIVNGGVYYQPHMVEATIDGEGNESKREPKIVSDRVVSGNASQSVVELMARVYQKNHRLYGAQLPRDGYMIGGKTGTAQIAKPEGGYYDDRFNGTYAGFVGGEKPKYVIVVRVDEPKVPGFAGAGAAAPLFGSIANMLIDNFEITPAR